LRINAKRTAFGDVSNTSYTVRASKDDIYLSGKNNKASTISAEDKKPIVLSQPAQRPVSVTGVKAILNSVRPRPSDNAPRQGLTDITSYNTANNRKLLTKRSNVVFKDHLPPVVEAKPSTAIKQAGPRASDPLKEDLGSRPSTASSYREYSKKEAKEAPLPAKLKDIEVNPSSLDIHSDSIYVIEPSVPKKDSPSEPAALEEEQPSRSTLTEAVSLPEVKDAQKPESTLPRDSLDLAHARSDSAVAPSEPEEWDEFDDNEEDDGYATARSHPSRSENTTGSAAIILVPKYNQKAKKEIAVARQLVETSRTTDDIEDEMWDTSMVAEYGDDIFDYMRELEVSLTTNQLDNLILTSPLDQDAAQRPLHGLPTRGSVVNALYPHRVAGPGSSPILPASRDFVPCCQLHRPLPLLQDC
jgi:hypothetical protein